MPRASAHYAIGDYPGDKRTRAQAATLWKQWVAGEPSWACFAGEARTGKTHLAVGVLRGVKLKRPRKRLAYVNATNLRAALGAYFDDRSTESPLAAFLRADYSVMENVDPERWPEWLRDAIERAIMERWDAQLPTLLTTKDPAKLSASFSSLPIGDAVRVCPLTRS